MEAANFFVDPGGSRAARPPAGARERARVARRGRREATRGRGEARDPSGRALDVRSKLFFMFSTSLQIICPSRFFGANAIVGAKHHGTVRGAHRERAPRTGDHDGVAVDRSSPEDGRGAGDTRAGVSALRCVPHRACALAPSPTCRPTVRLTILPFHAGAVPSGTTEYTNVQIANEEWSPGTSPSFLPRNAPRRPAVSRRSGHFASARGVAASPSRWVPDRDTKRISFRPDGRRRDECARATRERREQPFAPPFPTRAVRPGTRVRRDAHSESRDRSRSALARLPTTQRRLSGTPRRTCRLACGPTP